MQKNIGGTDKVIRLLAAVALIVLYFTGIITGTLGVVGLVIAAILLLTSLVNFCPLYALLGIKTCKV